MSDIATTPPRFVFPGERPRLPRVVAEFVSEAALNEAQAKLNRDTLDAHLALCRAEIGELHRRIAKLNKALKVRRSMRRLRRQSPPTKG